MKDKLTGLYDEKHFAVRMKEELDRAARYKRPLTVILFEINYNYFIKDYDIRWGMSYTLFKQFGALINKIYRNVDLAGRYKGEYFAVVLPETPEEGALIAAERLRKAVEEHEFLGDEKLPKVKIALNIGVAIFPKHGKSVSELITSAQQALLISKEKGGNVVTTSGRILYEE